jgi:NAD(P)-dependent dehydrogenase (short-subunit alcohol dehydrogenase family)
MHTPFDMTGKRILITGATGYLGRAMSVALAKAGAEVLINGRNVERCAELAEELRGLGLKVAPAVFDVTDSVAVAAYFREFADQSLHGLVNNAFVGAGGTIETQSSDAYFASYDVTVVAAHRLIQSALPALRRAVAPNQTVSIVNVLSMYGSVSPVPDLYDSPDTTNPPSYGAAKAALGQLTRYAACEFGPEGIRVNAVAPGPFPAPEVQREAPDFIARLSQRVPMKRIGQAEEIAGPVTFLLSSAASYVNGATLSVDGGWTSW